MKGADPHARVGQQRIDSGLHLASSSVRERDRENGAGINAAINQPRDAAGAERLRYASGMISAEEFLDTTFPGLSTLKSGLNRNPPVRFYVTGSRLWYAFDDNGARGYMDGHLDTFNCLLENYGPIGTLEKFRELNVHYFFFSRTLLQELRSEKNPTFQAKVQRFTDFAGKHLRVVWGSRDYMLFEMPTRPKK